jgi:hypothetical protein
LASQASFGETVEGHLRERQVKGRAVQGGLWSEGNQGFDLAITRTTGSLQADREGLIPMNRGSTHQVLG